MRTVLRYLPLVAVAAALNLLLFGDFLSGALPPRAPAAAADATTIPRIVVLVGDGVDFHILREYLDAGELENLQRLAEAGGLHPLLSETPPESPVALASMLTGMNPGRHGIFDFIRTDRDYEPQNGMVDVTPPRLAFDKIALRPPRLRSRLRAKTFTELVHEAGYPVLSLRQPLLFPAPNRRGVRMTTGLGTPDVAGTAGYSAVYSNEIGYVGGTTEFGCSRIALPGGPQAREFETYLEGPFDPTLGTDPRGGRRRARVPLTMRIVGSAEQPALQLQIDGQTEDVAVGERSGFLSASFALGVFPPRRVSGIVRFEVKSVDPVKVIADPVNFDPRDAPFPLSSPPSYGADLWHDYGPYETVGWQEQTFSLNDRFQNDRDFLRDLFEDMDRGTGMLLGEMEQGERLIFHITTATDRACHAFFRYRDRGHPLHEERTRELGDPIGAVLKRFDKHVGEVWARLDPDDTLIVCSDHGFQTWRWAMQINQWLVDEGYMALTGDAEHKTLDNVFGGVAGLAVVDWANTRAYAMGLGQIYLNLRGREDNGVVDPAGADALIEEIRTKLLALRFPYALTRAGGGGVTDRPVASVAILKDTYEGPFAHEAADLQVGFSRGYRVSWQTALLGGMRAGGPVFVPNDVPWSGDHCSSDPEIVKGILLSNRPIPGTSRTNPYHVRDIAATVLHHFGLETGQLDGAPIRFDGGK